MVQSSGGFLNFNPHCQLLCTDGGFFESGPFQVAPAFDTESLETLFAHKIHSRLLKKGEICKEVIKPILSWRDSVFTVHCSPGIPPDDDDVMENLARYIIRTSFSQERLTYVPDESKVIYQSRKETTLDAMECLAVMFSLARAWKNKR